MEIDTLSSFVLCKPHKYNMSIIEWRKNMGNKYYTPDGFNDQFPGICGFKRELESKLRNLFLLNGYEEIETPGVEYFDVYKEFVAEENLYTVTTERSLQ